MKYLLDNGFIHVSDARDYIYLKESNKEMYDWYTGDNKKEV